MLDYYEAERHLCDGDRAEDFFRVASQEASQPEAEAEPQGLEAAEAVYYSEEE